MKKIGKAVAALTRAMDEIAGYFLVAAVFLIVANIVAGVVFNSYILGTYEYVGFLTAAVIGLSLGYCALQGGHIAVDFLVEKFPPRARLVLELITGLATLTFFAFSSWHIVLYGLDTFRTGEIAPTTHPCRFTRLFSW